MIAATFRRFVEELSASYPEAGELPVRFTGGVAHAFGQELKEVAASYGIMVDMIVRTLSICLSGVCSGVFSIVISICAENIFGRPTEIIYFCATTTTYPHLNIP